MKIGYIMTISARYFVVINDSIKKISRKSMEDFYFNGKNTLTDYSGQIIDTIDVIVELQNRKPFRIIRLDGSRLKVDKNGGRDDDFHMESQQQALSCFETPAEVKSTQGVLDATDVFNERKLKNKHIWYPSDKIIYKIAKLLGV